MDYLKLSKEVSYALRHAPWEYELELDENGWVDIEQLLYSLRAGRDWTQVSENDLRIMITTSEKIRHEISNGKIRALYGHSTQQKIIKQMKEPPEALYHGTSERFLPSIKEQGLLPMGRQYVHLSLDIDTAVQVGKRRDYKPVILQINANKAWKEGVAFYQGNKKVWLADAISTKYIVHNW